MNFIYYVFTYFQAGLPQFAVPHVGDPSAGSWDRFSGTQRYSFHPWPTGVSPAAGTVVPSQNSIQESVYTSGELWNNPDEDRGQAGQGKSIRGELFKRGKLSTFVYSKRSELR